MRERLVFEIADRELDDGVLAMLSLDELERFGPVGREREVPPGSVPGRREAPRAARLCKPDWRRFPPAPLSTVRRVFPYTAGSERISVAAFPDMNRSVGAPTRPSDPSGPPGLACRLRRRRRT